MNKKRQLLDRRWKTDAKIWLMWQWKMPDSNVSSHVVVPWPVVVRWNWVKPWSWLPAGVRPRKVQLCDDELNWPARSVELSTQQQQPNHEMRQQFSTSYPAVFSENTKH